MNKREQRRQIEKELTENVTKVEVWQKKPYTAVKVITFLGESKKIKRVAYGFTKVCWPDEWNPIYGCELAEKKAIADISRRIVGNSGV